MEANAGFPLTVSPCTCLVSYGGRGVGPLSSRFALRPEIIMKSSGFDLTEVRSSATEPLLSTGLTFNDGHSCCGRSYCLRSSLKKGPLHGQCISWLAKLRGWLTGSLLTEANGPGYCEELSAPEAIHSNFLHFSFFSNHVYRQCPNCVVKSNRLFTVDYTIISPLLVGWFSQNPTSRDKRANLRQSLEIMSLIILEFPGFILIGLLDMSLLTIQRILLVAVITLNWQEVLSICPKQCSCVNFTSTCTNVKVFPFTLNPSIRRLELAHNQISAFDDTLTHYQLLEYLDMSHNDIASLGGKITFSQSRHLTVLRLNWNMISAIASDTLFGLVSLKILELRGNSIDELGAFSFSNLKSLKILDLSHNRIHDIHSNTFSGLVDLETLFLGHNKITNIPMTSFPKMKSLLNFDLEHNPLDSIPGSAFAPLSSLQKLSLNGCGFTKLGQKSFRGLISLIELHLDENPFTELPVEANLELPSLQKLVLGMGPTIRTIRANTFSRLSQLRMLVIQSAPELQIIKSSAFTEIPNLENISLSYNKKLRTIESGAFKDLKSLKSVNLRGNNLVSLSADLLPWSDLESFDIRGNSFRCDCDLAWLRDLLKHLNSTRNSSADGGSLWNVKCGEPPNSGRILMELDNTDLQCTLTPKEQLIIVMVVSITGTIFVVLVILGIKFRKKMSTYVKDSWNGRKKRSRNVQYQKTSNEEETIYKAANGSMKLTPVTEL
ncbi:Insulin-like growth factor-binding protein complex acid labile subunit [Nymphon striatum]|nr:Insulin-like growth factor-binding protein complex acid labile subunit [Nymphon striatum]